MWVKSFAIGLAVTVILPCVVHYGVITFSPAAQYYQYENEEEFIKMRDPSSKLSEAQREQLKKEYKDGIQRFGKHLFLAAVPVGILALAVGFIIPIPGIGTGLMFGGLVSLLYGFFTYWSDLPVGMRFVSLLIGLIFLIFAGWLKLGKSRA